MSKPSSESDPISPAAPADDGDDRALAADLFEMSLDNVCIAGFDGYFKRVNPSWTRTLGWTSEELLSAPVLSFVHPDDRQAVLDDRARLHVGQEVGPIVNRYRSRDGTYRWFEWRSVADPERQLVYAVARDITDKKRAERRLRQSEEREEALQRQLLFADRMASIGTLAAGVAHEINNPLAFVSANVDLIIDGLRDLEVGGELLDMALDAREGAERIRKIVAGLRTFSRAETESVTIVNVVPLLERSVAMTRNEIRHRARLVTDFQPIPQVEADEARLGQVFINLLINAAQATPEDGSDAHEIRLTTRTDAHGGAVIEVADTGQGIAPEVRGRIFDPFFTTKPIGVGTGLGLSICHNVVTALGGTITVESEPGQGTTFRVALPAATGAETSVATAAPRAGAQGRATVLVVDDEPAIGRLLGRVLSGHEVIALTTATEALDRLEQGAHFDVIFSDLMMPVMSGMDFYEALVERAPAMAERVVFMSGGAFTPRATAFLDRISAPLIDKPFDSQAVCQIVARFVGERPSG